MRLQVSGRRTDVDPVSALWYVREKSLAPFQQIRKQSVLEGMVLAFRNQVENLGLENVSAGVDVLATRLFGLRFLQKAQDAAVVFGFDDAVGAGVFNRRQNNRGHRLAILVLANHGFQIEVGQNVTVENHGRLANEIFGKFVSSGGAHRL